MHLVDREILTNKNYDNNGIYGRFSNSTEAFDFLAPLHSRYRSGHITGGYTAPDLAGLPPKLPSATSFIRRTLYAMPIYSQKEFDRIWMWSSLKTVFQSD